jgi:hypothetical protein
MVELLSSWTRVDGCGHMLISKAAPMNHLLTAANFRIASEADANSREATDFSPALLGQKFREALSVGAPSGDPSGTPPPPAPFPSARCEIDATTIPSDLHA